MTSTSLTTPSSRAATPRSAIGPDGVFTVTDLGSKNGTFARITDESPLEHGDYVFLGQQLLRVEIS
jgi:pSer/pThr/pTyr-binding forkhead associated (FHA) protein